MTSKLVETYYTRTVLLREEIAKLRSCQKQEPEREEYYEEKILILYEEYNRLLNACSLFYNCFGEKSI